MNMSKLSIKAVLGMSLMLFILTGCVTSPPPRLDAKFGEALEMAKAQQTLNPDASLNTEPVEGIDGPAADAGFDNYRDSFINPTGQSSGGIGFGTGSSSSVGGGGRR